MFVGTGSLIKKKLFLLHMLSRSNRRATVVKIYQLAIFVSELQVIVVRNVSNGLLRLAHFCKFKVQGLRRPVQVLFYKIVVFLRRYIRTIFGEG